MAWRRFQKYKPKKHYFGDTKESCICKTHVVFKCGPPGKVNKVPLIRVTKITNDIDLVTCKKCLLKIVKMGISECLKKSDI